MKIRKLTVKNYKMFDDLELDFTDSNGKALDLIVLTGVNGSGKTSILSLLRKLFSEHSNRFRLKAPLIDFEEESSGIICNEIVVETELTLDQVSYLANLISEFQQKVTSKQPLLLDPSVLSQLETVKQKLSAAEKTGNLSFSYKVAENPQGLMIDTNDFLPFGILDTTKLSTHFGILYFLANSLETKTEKTSTQNHDGIVQLLDIFAEKGTVVDHLVKSVLLSVVENRKLTGEQAIKNRIGEIHNLLQGIHLATQLVDISATQPLFESFNGKPVSIDELSSGEKQFYYRAALLNQLASAHHFLLVDEPETSLHPTWQREVVKLYRNAGSKNQVILATHSPHIIASVPPENLFVLHLDEESRQIKVFNAANVGRFTKGVEPNRILQEIMGMEELRDSETQQQISEIANLLRLRPEQVGLAENQEKIEKLREALGNGDPFIIRMDHQLLLIERRNLSSNEICQ